MTSTERSSLVAEVLARLPRALEAVRPHALTTPVAELELTGPDRAGQIQVKCEHLQHTGSFKVRGALAKLSAIGREQRRHGVIAASSGNHGLGVAHALSVLGGTGIVCVPENASAVKVAAIRRLGVEVRHLGTESGQTETLTRAYAAEHGLTYISPYNDLDVIAGQATVGAEILEQTDAGGLDVVVIAVGGGGLASGVAAAIKAARPHVRVIGAQPANDAVMSTSIRVGHVTGVDALPTLSDGTAGGIETDAVTFDLCRALVDEWVLVDEEEIAGALRLVIDQHHQLVEGAAGVAIAAAMKMAEAVAPQRVMAISCGANISANTLQKALDS